MFYGEAASRYLTVDEAARLLRMNAYTLYRNMADVPHIMVGTDYRIPCEFLMLRPPPIPYLRRVIQPEPYFQPYLPFEVKPERRWRNSKRLVSLDPFGHPL